MSLSTMFFPPAPNLASMQALFKAPKRTAVTVAHIANGEGLGFARSFPERGALRLNKTAPFPRRREIKLGDKTRVLCQSNEVPEGDYRESSDESMPEGGGNKKGDGSCNTLRSSEGLDTLDLKNAGSVAAITGLSTKQTWHSQAATDQGRKGFLSQPEVKANRGAFRAEQKTSWAEEVCSQAEPGEHGICRADDKGSSEEQPISRALAGPVVDVPLRPPRDPPGIELLFPALGTALTAIGVFCCLKILPFSPYAAELHPFIAYLVFMCGYVGVTFGWMFIIKGYQPSSASFLPREPGLSPDWHNLRDPRSKRVFYYNTATGNTQWDSPTPDFIPVDPTGAFFTNKSALLYAFHGVALQLKGLLFPVLTTGLYFSILRSAVWCVQAFLDPRFSLGSSIALSVLFLALPGPLPFLIILLSASKPSLFLPGAAFENILLFSLLLTLIPTARAFLGAVRGAARARLSDRDLAHWDPRALARLAAAACPALSWRLQPSALGLGYSRVVFFPLPFGHLLPVPVPRWELFSRSWAGLLVAATMALPLARLVAAATAVTPLTLPTFWAAVCGSNAVRVGVCVSVVEVLMRRQRDAHVARLTELSEQNEIEETETGHDLDRKALEEFDRKLSDGSVDR